MAQRHHLDSIQTPTGIIRYTLVFESPSNYFVEQCIDTNLPSVKDRVRKIPQSEFPKCSVNSVPLNKLVEIKMKEMVEASQFQQQRENSVAEIRESAA
jgi:hypothetical protein